ncbi:hypothetical protein [Glacieibacterium frigidum]|uniref:Uncharacterized protein n=1 Tax=Glacieibacterium frigidum TaxID=2593303 RepID=A0A552U918_9SPHN|nr:hypothetical protein [Glacieibacterium frigidum]TRW14679.1 hypothetical protein FMM06_13405 [Glacieibacterium frigidum]
MIRVLLLSLLAAAPALAVETAPRQCLSLPQIRNQRIVDGAILFRMGRQWYRNDMSNACTGLKPSRSIQTRTPSTQLCEGDLVRVFDPRVDITYGSCALGKFTPIDAPQPEGRRASR